MVSAAAGRPEWQDLPQALLMLGEKISESIRFYPQITDAEPARQGGEVEQDAARSGKVHRLALGGHGLVVKTAREGYPYSQE